MFEEITLSEDLFSEHKEYKDDVWMENSESNSAHLIVQERAFMR